MRSWLRLTIALASVAGITGVAIIWNRLDDPSLEYLALCSLPLLVGLGASIGRVTLQTRILVLWGGAAISGLVAALTIWSGAGFVLLSGMVVYLAAGWGLNDSGRRSA